jgi:8-oxo-dGTP diphosphatase
MPSADQGVDKDRYCIIPRTLIFLTRGDAVLLLKGAPHKRLWAGRFNGIGGHVEQGENVVSAAKRELWEETGLEATDLRLCATIIVDTSTSPGVGIYVLRGECSQGSLRPSDEGTLKWVSIPSIQDLPLVEDLYTLLPKILALKNDDPPLSLLYSYNQEGQLVINQGPP